MASRVAFLRGINVGGHRVKMAELRALFERAGFEDVSTFIASGNVIFDGGAGPSDAQERAIERLLGEALGYEVATFVRDLSELPLVASVPPFRPEELADPGWTLHVMFLRAAASDEERETLAALESERDEFRFEGREAYWLTRGRMSESPLFSGRLAKATAGIPHTMRSIKSLRKLLATFT
jgi:uncharacterized protein (DUF1697 family)